MPGAKAGGRGGACSECGGRDVFTLAREEGDGSDTGGGRADDVDTDGKEVALEAAFPDEGSGITEEFAQVASEEDSGTMSDDLGYQEEIAVKLRDVKYLVE